MATQLSNLTLKVLSIFIFTYISACATEPSPDTEEAVSNDSAENSEDQTSENAAPENEHSDALQNNAQAIPTANEAPQAEAPTPTTSTADTSMRVVRYVIFDDTQVLASPNGQEVSKLHQGDPVVIQVEGEWGKLTEGHYISLAKVSEKPIARNKKTNPWTAK